MAKKIKVILTKELYVDESKFQQYCEDKFLDYEAAELVETFRSIRDEDDLFEAKGDDVRIILEELASEEDEEVDFNFS